MAMINCNECGREISDRATSCPNCGAPIQQPMQGYSTNQVNNTVQPPIAQKQSGLGIVALVMVCTGCLSIMGVILAIIDLAKRDTSKKHTCAKIAIGIFAVIILIGILAPKEESSETETSTTIAETAEISEESESITETVPEEAEESIEEETEAPETESIEPAMSKEDFIASCEEIAYKTLARNPDDYIGTHIVLTVKVEQILQGGFFDDSQYYRVYTNDDYDMWLGDEYFMYDSRVDDDMKILQDDVLKVYAEFVGTETVKRALTSTNEDVPAFKAVYIELLEE